MYRDAFAEVLGSGVVGTLPISPPKFTPKIVSTSLQIFQSVNEEMFPRLFSACRREIKRLRREDVSMWKALPFGALRKPGGHGHERFFFQKILFCSSTEELMTSVGQVEFEHLKEVTERGVFASAGCQHIVSQHGQTGKCDTRPLVEAYQIARDNRLPVQCRRLRLVRHRTVLPVVTQMSLPPVCLPPVEACPSPSVSS